MQEADKEPKITEIVVILLFYDQIELLILFLVFFSRFLGFFGFPQNFKVVFFFFCQTN